VKGELDNKCNVTRARYAEWGGSKRSDTAEEQATVQTACKETERRAEIKGLVKSETKK
jgi:hypothetical protein